MLDKILAFVKFPATPARPAPRERAPATVRAAGSELGIAGCMQRFDGFPIVEWPKVRSWIEGLDAAQHAPAWWGCERAWLLHFRDALGPAYRLDESETAAMVSSLEPRVARAALEFMGRTLRRVERVLAGIAQAPAWGKDLLIVFQAEDDYYRYVSHYYPDKGEFAFSGGMHIDDGCGHFVTAGTDLRQIEPTIAHEMTHGVLGHLPIPAWLNEGLAVNTEHRLCGRGTPLHTPEQMHRKHQRFWSAQTIQEFWSGTSFQRTDEGNLLSYDLARVLVELLAKDWASFSQFVLQADRSDAGAAAARACLALDLGEAVRMLLDEDGTWSPQPEAWDK